MAGGSGGGLRGEREGGLWGGEGRGMIRGDGGIKQRASAHLNGVTRSHSHLPQSMTNRFIHT